jgi:retron-type reverse transcriptase
VAAWIRLSSEPFSVCSFCSPSWIYSREIIKELILVVVLNGFDHFIKERLGANKYVRYVDDFALFSDDQRFLRAAREAIETELTKLRLTIHPIKSQLFETRHGASFMGFRVFPRYLRVRSENLRRARRRLRRWQQAYRQGHVNLPEVTQALRSWIVHLAHGDTWQLRTQVFALLAFARA